MIELIIPIKSVSVANLRMHWAVKAKLAKSHRAMARTAMATVSPSAPGLPVSIVLTRVGPRTLDTDNLASSLKAVRDGISDWLGVDDGSPQIDWQYGQKRGSYAVEVEVI